MRGLGVFVFFLSHGRIAVSEPIFEQCGYPDFGIYHPFAKSPLGSGIPAANNDGTHPWKSKPQETHRLRLSSSVECRQRKTGKNNEG